jgi:hypothetical protein
MGCPQSKTMIANGKGTDLQFQPSTALRAFNVLATQAANVGEVLTAAENKCTQSLTADISRVITECNNYCKSVRGCVASHTITGPNTCDGDPALNCNTVNEIITNLFPSLGIPINRQFSAWRCTVSGSTTINCNCEEEGEPH